MSVSSGVVEGAGTLLGMALRLLGCGEPSTCRCDGTVAAVLAAAMEAAETEV